jgi:LuxR family quorum sensing-dependent transcriptional regulator
VVDHGRHVFAAVECLEKAADQQTLMEAWRACLEPFGFNSVLVTGLPDPPADPASFFLLNSWPSGWQGRYLAENFYRDDPVAAYGRMQSDPFSWRDVPVDVASQPRARQVMAEAAAAGMVDGYVIPVATNSNVQACVSVAGERPDLHPEVRLVIHVVGLYVHARAARLHLASPRRWEPRRRRLLSDREREVLRWTAAGKTAWETSCILGISERTVNYHIAMASRRLGAVSRTHAVARAIACGEISVS